MQMKLIVLALSGIYPRPEKPYPTFMEAMTFFEPMRRAIVSLAREVPTFRGYPIFVDWKGTWSRIDYALQGWADCWNRYAPDIDQTHLRTLAGKLAHGTPVTEDDLIDALLTLDRQQSRFMALHTDFIHRHTVTAEIAVRMADLGILEGAEQ